MRRSLALDGALPHYFLPFVAAMIALASLKAPAQAQTSSSFVIAATDGYGVAECLTSGGQCGQIVANAWCEAHGFAEALAFGLASDVTATINRASAAPAPEKGAIIIRCKE